MLVRSSKIRSRGIDTTIGKPGTRPKEFRHRSSKDGYLGAVVDVETKVRESEAEVDVTLLVETGKRIELFLGGRRPR